MERVVVTKTWVGMVSMQVCAMKDATDSEILEECNRENPSGMINGWNSVVRKIEKGSLFRIKKALPVECADDKSRKHFIVLC